MEKCKFNCTPKELRKCPKCGSSDTEFIESFYDDISNTIGGTLKFYEFECEDCGCKYRHVVKEVFIGIQVSGDDYQEDDDADK